MLKKLKGLYQQDKEKEHSNNKIPVSESEQHKGHRVGIKEEGIFHCNTSEELEPLVVLPSEDLSKDRLVTLKSPTHAPGISQ